MNKSAFAEALGISISLLTYLEKRRLNYASIPMRFIHKIAESLKTSEESIAAYLQGGPKMSAQASFKADQRPISRGVKDFLEAVNEDPGLTAEQKQELIDLE